MKINYMIILIIVLALYGCMGGGNSTEVDDETTATIMITEVADTRSADTGFMPGYDNWVSREFTAKPKSQDGIIDLQQAVQIAQDVFNRVEWRQKEGDQFRWNTSFETEQNGFGNCVDIAIDIYVKLRNAGFADSEIGIMHMEKIMEDGKHGHSVPYVISDGTIHLLDLSNRSDWTMVQAWNLYNCWKL